LFFVYSLGLYFVNACLKYTTLGSASILGATCSFFTLFLGNLLKVEKFSLLKGAAVVTTFVGVVVNSLPSVQGRQGLGSSQTWGNLLSLFGALCYANFLVFLQKQTVGRSGLNRPLLFAFIGLFTMIFCWPVFIYLHKSGQERLELPKTGMVYLFLGLKIVLGSVIPTYLWNVTFALTSPLYIAVGTSLCIPLNLVADWVMGNGVSWSGAIGAAFVTAGCFIMNLAYM
jgi:solute carrier family 35 protein F5